MSNPYQTPPDNRSPASSRLLRSIALAVTVWLAFILLASAFGALMSFYTGKAADLPKWNGWSYLLFSAKEFAMFAAILTWPISLVLFTVSVILANRPKRS